MAKQNANRNSKAMRNLKSATNSTLRTTGNVATKGIEKTAKWLVTDHTGATQRTSKMELEQSANYSLASMALGNRRVERLNDSGYRLIDTGVDDSTFEVAVGWLIEHALYIWVLLWGFIWPIVSYFLMSIFTVLIVVMFNVIFFYALFCFLFS